MFECLNAENPGRISAMLENGAFPGIVFNGGGRFRELAAAARLSGQFLEAKGVKSGGLESRALIGPGDG